MTTETNPLLQALSSLGFVYQVRTSARGTPYAGLRWESVPTRGLRAFTAIYEAGALRLTLHAPLGAGARLDATERLERVSALPLVRLERGEDDPAESQLTLALPLEPEEVTPALVRALLAHLASAGDRLVAGEHGAGPLGWPRVADTSDTAFLEAALSSLGLRWREDESGAARVVDMALPGLGAPATFSVTTVDGGWVRVVAWLHEAELTRARARDDLADRLQQWAPVGRFGLVARGGAERLAADVAAPLVGKRPEDALAQALRGAVQLLGTAHKHAQAPGRSS